MGLLNSNSNNFFMKCILTSIAFSHVSRYVIKRTMIITIYISTTTFFTLTSKIRGEVFFFFWIHYICIY